MTKSSTEQFSEFLLDFLPSLLPKPVDSTTKLALGTIRGDVDSLIRMPRLQKELLEAAQKAESDFRSEAKKKLTNDKLVQAIASFPIYDNELFQKTLASLPDHLKEDFLVQDLQKIIADDWRGEFLPIELRQGIAIYLNCLRVQLLKVAEYADLITQLAILRIDIHTTDSNIKIERIDKTLKDLSSIISRSRKRERCVTKNDISQVEQLFNCMSDHAYQPTERQPIFGNRHSRIF